jgi:hypothetical protein
MTDSKITPTGQKAEIDGHGTHELHEYAGGLIKARLGIILAAGRLFRSFYLGLLLYCPLLGRTRAGADRLIGVSRAEIKALLGVKIIFGIAIINLMVLGFELAMNVIRTITG